MTTKSKCFAGPGVRLIIAGHCAVVCIDRLREADKRPLTVEALDDHSGAITVLTQSPLVSQILVQAERETSGIPFPCLAPADGKAGEVKREIETHYPCLRRVCSTVQHVLKEISPR